MIKQIFIYLLFLANLSLAVNNESALSQDSHHRQNNKAQVLESKRLRELVNRECPSVVVCGTSDTAKQVAKAVKQDVKASNCYVEIGDTEMAKISTEATTRCQTMLGSINPSIRN